MEKLRATIETNFERITELNPKTGDASIEEAVTKTLHLLNSGKIRVAEKQNGSWITHDWIKKAILLSFRLYENKLILGGITPYYDKLPLKFSSYNSDQFQKESLRVVPNAIARHGAYVAANTILMPSYINIGAYVDEGTMIDTWATVGSCAQIGKNVHLSGGVGIGGVLEPLQSNPTIIEDNCFIGARSEIVEGVVVEQGSVISMGVFIGQSTRIYDRDSKHIYYGRVPAGSVVVSGNLPAQNGSHSLYCAVIVKKVDARTRAKIPLNELLRCYD